jgi:molybdopterin molybdotransferase
VLAELGIPMDFWRVAMKPGKPLAFGVAGGRPVFGLPGNPVSCMVNFYQFVRPVLRRMVGDPRPFLPVLDVELTGVFRRKPGRPELLRVRLWREGEQIRGTVAGHQGSAGVQALIAGDRTEVSGRVAVQVFDTSFLFGTAAAYRW